VKTFNIDTKLLSRQLNLIGQLINTLPDDHFKERDTELLSGILDMFCSIEASIMRDNGVMLVEHKELTEKQGVTEQEKTYFIKIQQELVYTNKETNNKKEAIEHARRDMIERLQRGEMDNSIFHIIEVSS